jgi:hypothetical protein
MFNLAESKTKKKATNPIFLKASEIAKITGTTPTRWLREVKNHPWAVDRALNELKDLTPNSKIKYFQWLLKKFKGEEKNGK